MTNEIHAELHKVSNLMQHIITLRDMCEDAGIDIINETKEMLRLHDVIRNKLNAE